jgi:APA family basic amino acid/polyamine antiporter
MPVTPVLGILFSLWLVSKLSVETWIRFAAWFVLGGLIYAFYGYRNSRLGRGKPVEGSPEADLV